MLLVLFNAYLADRVARDSDFLRVAQNEGLLESDSENDETFSPRGNPVMGGSGRNLFSETQQRSFKSWLLVGFSISFLAPCVAPIWLKAGKSVHLTLFFLKKNKTAGKKRACGSAQGGYLYKKILCLVK